VSTLVVLSVGIDGDFEGENKDRRALEASIEMPGAQVSLVEQVAAAAKSPIIVLLTGSSVDISPIVNNSKVGAILWRGYAGEASAQATWDIVFGAYNPSGKLTTTWYPQSFVTAWKGGVMVDPYLSNATASPPSIAYYNSHNASFFDHHTRPNQKTGNPGRGHRFYTGRAVARFGDGMSYSTFDHALLSPAQAHVSLGSIQVYAAASTRLSIFRRDHPLAQTVYRMVVNVSNAGPLSGATTLLGFIHPPAGAGPRAPIRSLFAFEKIHLGVGQSAQVVLNVTEHDLTLTARDGGRRCVEGEWRLQIGNGAAVQVAVAVGVDAPAKQGTGR
jgi:hypothetical protein